MACRHNTASHIVQYTALLMLIGFALYLRLSVSEPILAPDTGGYTILAEAIEQGTLEEYSFARTPGFPLLMLLFQYDLVRLVTLQYIIAILSIYMLYTIVNKHIDEPYLAYLCIAIYILNYNIWSLSSTILTDSLAASLALFAIAFMFKSVIHENNLKYVTYSSIIITLGILVRPILATILIAYTVVYVITQKPSVRYCVALIAPLIMLIPWVYVVWSNTGKFGVTTLMPKNITNHTGAFLEYADDEFSRMRDPYIQERDARGTHVMTIFRAQDSMRANYPELSDTEYNSELMRMSVSAIKAKPFLYFKSVLYTVARNHIPCNPSEMFLSQLGDGFLLRLWARRGSKLLLMLFELLTYIYFGIRIFRKKMNAADWLFAAVLFFFILSVSMLESPNGRYLMPVVFIYYIYGCKFVYEYAVLRFLKQH